VYDKISGDASNEKRKRYELILCVAGWCFASC
jgi:hypothetical protein